MPAVLLARYRVTDRGRFVEVFDDFDGERVRAGATGATLLAAEDDPGTLVAMIGFPTPEAARAFARSPGRADALARATVVDRTDEILEVERPRPAR